MSFAASARPIPAGRLRAALLDLDGTLVDSLPALRSAYHRFLAAHDRTGSDEEFAQWNGPPLGQIVAGLAATHAIFGDGAALLDEYARLVEEAYVAEAPLAPGALALLDWFAHEGIALALVTSAPARLASALLEQGGVRSRFTALVGGDEVAHGKPAPDGYREALARLGIEPVQAVVIEDSPAGVSAARAAGVRCVAVAPGVAPASVREELTHAGAVAVAASLDEARAICEGLHRGSGRVVRAARIVVKVDLVERPLRFEVARQIDATWAAAVSERPGLRDGEIVALTSWRASGDGVHVDAELTHYRRFLAQRRGIPVGVHPLGVTAVTRLTGRGDDRLVLGRRASGVTQYPGCWELVPSGGIARRRVATDGSVDVEGQVLEELEEELGVPSEQVMAIVPVGLIEDLDDGVVDLCYRIDVDADEEAVRRGILRHLEYIAVELLPPAEVVAFCTGRGEGMVPTVPALIDLLA
ncbi:MAG: HAD family phosphatase [Myxococcales bacterium]|nr:HAD family phosphatase [Myxococcales bacterium]